jgi:WD40 repeat protein
MLRVIHVLDCGSFRVNSAAFSSDGTLFASASDNGTIRLWHANGTLQQTLNGHDEPVDCVTFSPNSKLLMSASDDDYTLRLWNVDDGTVQELVGYSGPVTFSPDSTAQASCSGDGRVKLWGAVSKTLEVGQPLAVTPRSKRHHQVLDGWPDVTALAFSPNGSLLACGYDNGMLKLWEMVSEYADDHPGHEDAIIALAFSQDGKIIASASHSGTIRLWDIRQACYTFQLQGSWVGVHCLAFSPDGKLLASASFDKQIRLWDLAQKKLLYEVKAAGTICALSFLRSIRVGVCNDQAQGSYSINICEITI